MSNFSSPFNDESELSQMMRAAGHLRNTIEEQEKKIESHKRDLKSLEDEIERYTSDIDIIISQVRDPIAIMAIDKLKEMLADANIRNTNEKRKARGI